MANECVNGGKEGESLSAKIEREAQLAVWVRGWDMVEQIAATKFSHVNLIQALCATYTDTKLSKDLFTFL